MKATPGIFVLFLLLPFCEGQENHALAANGATCTTSFGFCDGAIDGIVHQLNSNKWQITGSPKGQWIHIIFPTAVTLRRVVIKHPYWAAERNCKQIELKFGGSKTVELTHGADGYNVMDTIDIFSTPTTTLTITCTEEYDENQEYMAIEEIEVYSSIEVRTTPKEPTKTTQPTSSTAPTPAPLTPRLTTTTTQPPTTQPPTTQPPTTQPPTTTTTAPTTPTTTTTTKPPTTTTTKPPTTTTTAAPSSTTSSAPPEASTAGPSDAPSTTEESSGVESGGGGFETTNIIIIAVVGCVVLLLLLIVFIVCCCLRLKKKEDPEEPVLHPPPSILTVSGPTKLEVYNDPLEEENLAAQPAAKLIKVKDLPQYVKDMNSESSKFQKEFKSIPSGVIATATAGSRQGNKDKNRYGNIQPYDGNRVVLTTINSDPESTYINASFIDGYHGPKQFIASQGPNVSTVADFWRMIWEQNVSIVLMVTNCVEGERTKCEQYWPDEGNQVYNNMEVSKETEDVDADFTIRELKIRKASEHRTVTQYHYTSWPDEGVPDTGTALIQYARRVRSDATAIAANSPGAPPPIVVHCSAGVGRTGTYIALNILLDQAKVEKMVDINSLVRTLRTKRPNMIQSLEQYKFLHYVLLEALYCPAGVSIPCRDFTNTHQRLQELPPGREDTMMEVQFEILDVFKNHNYNAKCEEARKEENAAKIRNQDVLPSDSHRAHIIPLPPACPSTFVNAVFTKGYKTTNDLLITQSPFPDDVIDIWRLSTDFDCSTVIRLNPVTDDAPNYLPAEGENSLTVGLFTVRRLLEDTKDDITITDLEVTSEHRKGEPPQKIRHFYLNSWDPDAEFPVSMATLISLYDHVTEWKRGLEKKRLLVHCLDGGNHCGLFCCVLAILEKMNDEQRVDVFNAVKSTRYGRPLFIPNLEHYEYLYNLAALRLADYEDYANFRQ